MRKENTEVSGKEKISRLDLLRINLFTVFFFEFVFFVLFFGFKFFGTEPNNLIIADLCLRFGAVINLLLLFSFFSDGYRHLIPYAAASILSVCLIGTIFFYENFPYYVAGLIIGGIGTTFTAGLIANSLVDENSKNLKTFLSILTVVILQLFLGLGFILGLK